MNTKTQKVAKTIGFYMKNFHRFNISLHKKKTAARTLREPSRGAAGGKTNCRGLAI